MRVEVKNGNMTKALKQLKIKMQNNDVYREVSRHEFYEKPSEKRKRKRKDAASRRRKAEKFKEKFTD